MLRPLTKTLQPRPVICASQRIRGFGPGFASRTIRSVSIANLKIVSKKSANRRQGPVPLSRTTNVEVTRDAPRVAARDGGGCNIKGNISHNSGKRIYHMPGDRDYERTRISSSRGEKYFCTQARRGRQGWRRAGR